MQIRATARALAVVAVLVAGIAAQDGVRTDDDRVARIAGLRGAAQKNALREVLVRDLERETIVEAIFQREDKLRPALRSLVSDRKVGERATNLLAIIGAPEDLRFIIQFPPPSDPNDFPNRWAYGVACSLLYPSSEEEWMFLRKCALNEYDDRWVDAGAIQTLKLIASPRSREILEAALTVNQDRSRLLAEALEYVASKPAPLASSDLDALATRVGGAVKIGNWDGSRRSRYSAAGDWAFVDFDFIAGRDRLTYTATFRKVDTVWRLHGIQETMQGLMPAPPPPTPAQR